MTTEHDRELEAMYGEEPKHSEHKRGDHIHYISAEGLHCEGEILWCCATGMVSNEYMGLKYI